MKELTLRIITQTFDLEVLAMLDHYAVKMFLTKDIQARSHLTLLQLSITKPGRNQLTPAEVSVQNATNAQEAEVSSILKG